MIQNLTKIVDSVDQVIETSGERQNTLTERHANDMKSDNWLSKSIRPLSVLVLLLVICFIAILSAFDYHVDVIIYGELSAIFMTALGFYFNSKKAERVMAQKAKISIENVKANVELKKLKAKHEIKKERKQLRHERRLQRRKRRNQDDEDYDKDPTDLLIEIENENL